MPDNEHLSVLEIMSGVVSILAHKNVIFVVWHAKAIPEAVERLRQLGDNRRKEFAHGVSVVHLIRGQFELPDSRTRDAFVRATQESASTVAVVAVVIVGGGFWASAIRSMVTGVRVLSRGTFDLGLHTSLDELIKWLPAKHFARTGVDLSPELFGRLLRNADSYEQPEDVFSEAL